MALAILLALAACTTLLLVEVSSQVRVIIYGLVTMAIVATANQQAAGPRPLQASRAFSPWVFPLIYACFSFLTPLWFLEVAGVRYGALAREYVMSPSTTIILGSSLIAFGLGCALGARSGDFSGPTFRVCDYASATLLWGRIVAFAALIWLLASIAQFSIETRGVGQLNRDLGDSLVVLQTAASMAGAALIVSARQASGARSTLGLIDAVLLAATVAAFGIRGSRGDALALLIVVLAMHTRRHAAKGLLVAGLIGSIAFSYAVLQYRAADPITRSPIETVVSDTASIAFTTGATAAIVADRQEYHAGSTLVAGLKRQLPGPISNALFGAPDDTGARVFRDLIAFKSPDQGFGYSIPAEGVLNFGLLGAVGLCWIYGAILARLYLRSFTGPGTANYAIYAVAIANVPFALRSDLLGAMKGTLYPALIILMALYIARLSERKLRT